MDQIGEGALQTLLLGLALLRVRSTPVSAPKGTVRTDIIGTTALGMTETRIGLGMNLQTVSQRRSLYVTSVISQATMPLVAQNVRSLRRPKFNRLSRSTTRHQQPVLSLLPD